MSTLTIKEMLASGKTPDDLLKEINQAKRELEQERKEKEREAAKQKEHAEKVAAARDKVVQAMKEYSKLLYGVEPDITLMDGFNKDLKSIENEIEDGTIICLPDTGFYFIKLNDKFTELGNLKMKGLR